MARVPLISAAVLAGLLLGAGACSAPKTYLPPTPEAQTCGRSCAAAYDACRKGPKRYPVQPYSAPPDSRPLDSEARSCSREQSSCRMACPGATARPPPPKPPT